MTDEDWWVGKPCIGYGYKWCFDLAFDNGDTVHYHGSNREVCDVAALDKSNVWANPASLAHGPYCKECASWNWGWNEQIDESVRNKRFNVEGEEI